MITFAKRAARYLGHRGGALVLLAFIFSCYGLQALVDPVPDQGHFSLYAFLPPVIRVILWIGASLFAALTLARKERRDWLAFAILSIPPMILIVSHIVSYIGYLAGLTTYDAGLLRALAWVGILGLSTLIASWPEVPVSPELEKPGQPLPELRTQTALILEESKGGTHDAPR